MARVSSTQFYNFQDYSSTRPRQRPSSKVSQGLFELSYLALALFVIFTLDPQGPLLLVLWIFAGLKLLSVGMILAGFETIIYSPSGKVLTSDDD